MRTRTRTRASVSRKRRSETMMIGATDYATAATPHGYVCGTYGAKGCKLWREYQTVLKHQTLSCCDCAGKSQEKAVSGIDAEGKIDCEIGRSDAIGWRVPPVPTDDGLTFWGYTSVPRPGCECWRTLPTRPA